MAGQEMRLNHTIYINNLNEKIKKDGTFIFMFSLPRLGALDFLSSWTYRFFNALFGNKWLSGPEDWMTMFYSSELLFILAIKGYTQIFVTPEWLLHFLPQSWRSPFMPFSPSLGKSWTFWFPVPLKWGDRLLSSSRKSTVPPMPCDPCKGSHFTTSLW